MATQIKKSAPVTKKETRQAIPSPEIDFAFGKENYQLMLIGIAVIIIGFALMAGGNPDDPTAFSMDIFDTQRITIAPIVVLAGFLIEVYAIVKKAKD